MTWKLFLLICLLNISLIQADEDSKPKEDPIAKKIQEEYLKSNITIPNVPLDTPEPTSPEAYAYLYCSRTEFDPNLVYFNALRLAVYKLKLINQHYDLEPKDIIITICSYTPQWQIDVLKALDVIILVIDPIIPSGEVSENGHYIDQFTKFQLWRLTNWKRILYLDIDTTVTRNVIKIWDEPAAQIRTESEDPDNAEFYPYLFAAVEDLWERQHSYQTKYFNAGLFMLMPSIDYFKRLVDGMNKNNIRRVFMEQDFLNSFYANWSPNPAIRLPALYNHFFDQVTELEPGTAIIHCKFWSNNYPHLQTYVSNWWDDFGHLFNNTPLSLERVYDVNDEFYIESTNKEAYVFLLKTEREQLEEDFMTFQALKQTVTRLQDFEREGDASRDIIVFTVEETPSWQLKELQALGALVIRMKHLYLEEVDSTLSDDFIKVIFWKLVHWDRLLYVDNDIFVNDKQFLDIWDEDSTQIITEPKQNYNVFRQYSSEVFLSLCILWCLGSKREWL